jgi:hypothetical protein
VKFGTRDGEKRKRNSAQYQRDLVCLCFKYCHASVLYAPQIPFVLEALTHICHSGAGMVLYTLAAFSMPVLQAQGKSVLSVPKALTHVCTSNTGCTQSFRASHTSKICVVCTSVLHAQGGMHVCIVFTQYIALIIFSQAQNMVIPYFTIYVFGYTYNLIHIAPF